MDEAGGNKTKAAAILSVSYKTLLSKLKDYAIGPAVGV
jgi:DNA-binding protein Fis